MESTVLWYSISTELELGAIGTKQTRRLNPQYENEDGIAWSMCLCVAVS